MSNWEMQMSKHTDNNHMSASKLNKDSACRPAGGRWLPSGQQPYSSDKQIKNVFRT